MDVADVSSGVSSEDSSAASSSPGLPSSPWHVVENKELVTLEELVWCDARNEKFLRCCGLLPPGTRLAKRRAVWFVRATLMTLTLLSVPLATYWRGFTVQAAAFLSLPVYVLAGEIMYARSFLGAPARRLGNARMFLFPRGHRGEGVRIPWSYTYGGRRRDDVVGYFLGSLPSTLLTAGLLYVVTYAPAPAWTHTAGEAAVLIAGSLLAGAGQVSNFTGTGVPLNVVLMMWNELRQDILAGRVRSVDEAVLRYGGVARATRLVSESQRFVATVGFVAAVMMLSGSVFSVFYQGGPVFLLLAGVLFFVGYSMVFVPGIAINESAVGVLDAAALAYELTAFDRNPELHAHVPSPAVAMRVAAGDLAVPTASSSLSARTSASGSASTVGARGGAKVRRWSSTGYAAFISYVTQTSHAARMSIFGQVYDGKFLWSYFSIFLTLFAVAVRFGRTYPAMEEVIPWIVVE